MHKSHYYFRASLIFLLLNSFIANCDANKILAGVNNAQSIYKTEAPIENARAGLVLAISDSGTDNKKVSEANSRDIDNDNRKEIEELNIKVDTLSHLLDEQTGIFSIIIVITLTLLALITFTSIKNKFSEKLKSVERKYDIRIRRLNKIIIREDRKRETKLLK